MAENLNVSLTVHGVPGISTDLTSAEQLSIVKEKEVAPAPTAQAQPIPTTTNLAYSEELKYKSWTSPSINVLIMKIGVCKSKMQLSKFIKYLTTRRLRQHLRLKI
ncbi:uncharacterized protein LOC107810568 [Nicotiana tabacum]|uniref:Uncharacterized protein LOC107810568 n=1 Tax=Nicotiana tabacum TaxID=4097 RepID=A0AC58RYR3_TOBAC